MTEVDMEKVRRARNTYAKQWKAKNADKIRERNRRWRAENPEKVREYNLRYWAKRADREEAEAQGVQEEVQTDAR